MGKRVKNLHICNDKPLHSVCPRYGMAFKIPLGSSILHLGQPKPHAFKYFALNAMGHLEELHSFLASN